MPGLVLPPESAQRRVTRLINDTPRFYTAGKFVTTSDRMVFVYPDSRRVFSDTKKLTTVAREIIRFIKSHRIKFDMILGGASAGISLATAVALLMRKPIGYVRTKPKAGGMGLAVEGNWQKGMTVLLIDDALGHAAGKRKFIHEIRKAGLKVNWVIAMMSRNHHSRKYLGWTKQLKINFCSFTDITDMVKDALKRRILTPEAGQLLTWFTQDAENWHRDPVKLKYAYSYLKQRRLSRSGV